ncbi:26S proteasome non-ATPase regulatory subunit 7 [Aphelenchoides fujianensis]|nr:26S proteasome non-ATPase regulatory subunit 7 [Aphelenchoides fujianensis]
MAPAPTKKPEEAPPKKVEDPANPQHCISSVHVNLPVKKVVVHPLVLLNTVDHFTRISKTSSVKRVVGVLLGSLKPDKTLDVANSFAVPFDEDEEDKKAWFLDRDYLEEMYHMFFKVAAKEKIVGWYHTGPKLSKASDRFFSLVLTNDIAINEQLKRFTPNPVLVVIQALPKDLGLPTEAYIEVQEVHDDGTPPIKTFEHVPSEIGAEEAEEVGVEHLLRDIKDQTAGTLSQRITDQVLGLRGLGGQLADIERYLREVARGELPVNHAVIYYIQEMLNLLPDVTKPEFVEAHNVQTNDQLMSKQRRRRESNASRDFHSPLIGTLGKPNKFRATSGSFGSGSSGSPVLTPGGSDSSNSPQCTPLTPYSSFSAAVGHQTSSGLLPTANVVPQVQSDDRGSISLSLNYDRNSSTLQVSVLACHNLLDYNSTGPNDQCHLNPYVKLRLSDHRAKTRVVRKTRHPFYDEQFEICGIHYDQLHGMSLHLAVLNFDRFSRDTVIGEAFVNLAAELNRRDVNENKQTIELPLFPRPTYDVRAQVLLSMSHNPQTNSVNVAVLKVKDLPSDDRIGLIDPYVKPMNAAFSTFDSDYVAFCAKGQLYIDKNNQQVFTTASDASNSKVTNGLASFVVQEELERDEGFWWSPKRLELIYERVDERAVCELSFVVPGKQPHGTENASSYLHLVTFEEKSGKFVDRPLLTFFENILPEYSEYYIARAGWTDDGDSFYVMLMNRQQSRRAIVVIGKDAFTFASSEPRDLPIKVIYEEQSTIWINHNNATFFLPSTHDAVLRVIYASEKSDFCHLYMHQYSGPITETSHQEFAITKGAWPVIKDVTPTVDDKRQLIFFLANCTTPVRTMLCVASYKQGADQTHKPLTPAHLCYKFDRSEPHLHLPECHFYGLVHHADQPLPDAQFRYRVRLQPCVMPPLQNGGESKGKLSAPPTDEPMSPAAATPDDAEPPMDPEKIFTHRFFEVKLQDGTTVNSLVLLPANRNPFEEKTPGHSLRVRRPRPAGGSRLVDHAIHDEREIRLKNVRQLTFGGVNGRPTVSSDGKKLVYTSVPLSEGNQRFCKQLYVLDLEQPIAHPELISSHYGAFESAAFLPGGHSLVVSTDYKSGQSKPDCTPTGDFFLRDFKHSPNRPFELQRMNLHREMPVPLIGSDEWSAIEVAVAPNGRDLCFVRVDEWGRRELWTSTIDGTNAKRLAENVAYVSSPAFSPDGAEIVVLRSLHALVNLNASAAFGFDEWLSVEDYARCLRENVFDLIAVCHEFLPLIKQSRGRIINLSGVHGKFAQPAFGPLGLAQAGVEFYSDLLRRELSPLGVRVIVVQSPPKKGDDRMVAEFRAVWSKLPAHLREAYGEEFERKITNRLTEMNRSFFHGAYTKWTVGACFASVTSAFPRRRYATGIANLLYYTPVSFLPAILQDFVHRGFVLCTRFPPAPADRPPSMSTATNGAPPAAADLQELVKLRSNAENLAQCLQALQARIEQMEARNLVENGRVDVVRSETISLDPVHGIKKRTIVTEKLLTSRTYHAAARLPPDPNRFAESSDLAAPTGSNGTAAESARSEAETERLLSLAFQARIVAVDAADLRKIEVESICGEMVVTKVDPKISSIVHPGDTILEVNGEPVQQKEDLQSQTGLTKLKLVLSTIYTAPMEFAKVLEDFHASDEQKLDPYLSISLRKGDVLQVMSRDGKYLQARKVNDLSRAGFIPASLRVQNVAMMSPYGRRTLVLLGACGVGRRTLKAMLLNQLPSRFATVVPYTSRPPRLGGEQEGREYHFKTKEELRELIRNKQMIEWGEYGNQIYGTTTASVRNIVRSGRMCVLDCAPQALQQLYNREFMPYIVVIAPPALDELQSMCKLRGDKCKKTDGELQSTCEENAKLMQSEYARYFDLVLVNRNHEITFRCLLDALEHLKNEPQWRQLRVARERLVNEYMAVLNRLQSVQRRAASKEKAQIRSVADEDEKLTAQHEQPADDPLQQLQIQEQRQMAEGFHTRSPWAKKTAETPQSPPITSFAEIMSETLVEQLQERELDDFDAEQEVLLASLQEAEGDDGDSFDRDLALALKLSEDPDCSEDDSLVLGPPRVHEGAAGAGRGVDGGRRGNERKRSTSAYRANVKKFPPCGFIRNNQGEIITKHDKQVGERRNCEKMMIESTVLHALLDSREDGPSSAETSEEKHFAIKVYKQSLNAFKNRAEYVKDDFRSPQESSRNPQDLGRQGDAELDARDVENILEFFGNLMEGLPSKQELFGEITDIRLPAENDLVAQVEAFERENPTNMTAYRKRTGDYELMMLEREEQQKQKEAADAADSDSDEEE